MSKDTKQTADPVKELLAKPDFLPVVEGRITTSNQKWRKLSPEEKAAIQASRESAMGNFLAQGMFPGEKKRDDPGSLWLLQYHPNLLTFYREAILDAVDKKDVPFFVRLGEILKKAKKSPGKVTNKLARHILKNRPALFLVDRWLSEPVFSDTVFWHVLHSVELRSALGPELLSVLDSPLSYVCGGGLVEPVEKRGRYAAPGLCFFSYGALAKVCRFLLQDPSITRAAVIKTISRSRLKRCTRRELIFTHVEENGDTLLVSRR